jgi:hypothetical protein
MTATIHEDKTPRGFPPASPLFAFPLFLHLNQDTPLVAVVPFFAGWAMIFPMFFFSRNRMCGHGEAAFCCRYLLFTF